MIAWTLVLVSCCQYGTDEDWTGFAEDVGKRLTKSRLLRLKRVLRDARHDGFVRSSVDAVEPIFGTIDQRRGYRQTWSTSNCLYMRNTTARKTAMLMRMSNDQAIGFGGIVVYLRRSSVEVIFVDPELSTGKICTCDLTILIVIRCNNRCESDAYRLDRRKSYNIFYSSTRTLTAEKWERFDRRKYRTC